jgi:Na+-driven multidrug efflux pump
VILILSDKIGIFAVWLSFPIADLLALVFAIVLYRFRRIRSGLIPLS